MKKIAYLLLVVAITTSLIFSIKYLFMFREREANHSFNLAKFRFVQESRSIESRVVGLNIEDFLLESAAGEEINIHSLIKENDYTVLIVSSISVCSACRDEELVAWQEIAKKNNNMSIYLIAAESMPVSNINSRKLKGIVDSLGITIPLFFDREGSVLTFFALNEQETPIAILIDDSGRIVSANRPSTLTVERSTMFREDVDEILKD